MKHKKEVLFLERTKEKSSSGIRTFPGGKVEAGETQEQAVTREVFEETGYVFSKSPLLLDTHYISGQNGNYTYKRFKFEVKNKFTPKLNSSEHIAFKRLSLEDALATLNLTNDQQDLLKKLVEKET